jgi:hypothetical protein
MTCGHLSMTYIFFYFNANVILALSTSKIMKRYSWLGLKWRPTLIIISQILNSFQYSTFIQSRTGGPSRLVYRLCGTQNTRERKSVLF